MNTESLNGYTHFAIAERLCILENHNKMNRTLPEHSISQVPFIIKGVILGSFRRALQTVCILGCIQQN